MGNSPDQVNYDLEKSVEEGHVVVFVASGAESEKKLREILREGGYSVVIVT